MENQSVSLDLKHLRTRFVSDMNLPIQVIQSPYFEDRLELLEDTFGAKTRYENLIKLIDERFEGNSNKFLEYYHKIRDNIINATIESDAYKDFLIKPMDEYKVLVDIPNRNLYTQEQNGCMFISFDMKKANFQALRFINPRIVFFMDSYESMISLFTDLDYIKESKYTRQVIFGKLNPKRVMQVEKHITSKLALNINEFIDMSKLEFFSMNADELIMKFNGTEEEFEKIETLKETIIDGVTFRINKFKLHHRQFKLATSDASLNVYEKEDYLDGHRRHLHCVPSTYFPQVYKLLGGLEITPSDLVFYYEHELCQFMNPLTLVK